MGWIDILLGKPTMDKLAKLVIKFGAELGQPGMSYLHARAEVRGGGSANRIINLGRIFHEYRLASRRDRKPLVRRFVEGLLSAESVIPQTYEEAQKNILPVLRIRGDIATNNLYFKLGLLSKDKADEPVILISRPVVGELDVTLAFDTPRATSPLHDQQLRDWGKTFDEILPQAIDNLRLKSTANGWTKVASGVWSGNWSDGYASSRLLIPEIFYQLDITDPVVIAAERDVITVASGRDAEALNQMVAFLVEIHPKFTRNLSVQMYELINRDWRTFDTLKALGSPAKQHLAKMLLSDSASAYGDQKSTMEEWLELKEDPVFVATFSGVEKPNGDLLSYACWTQGVDTLLPKVDKLVFRRDIELDDTLAVPWDKAVEIVDSLLTVDSEWNPPRYRARRFPDNEQWQQLKANAGDL